MQVFVIFEQPFRTLAWDVPSLTERIREVMRDRPWLPTAPAHSAEPT